MAAAEDETRVARRGSGGGGFVVFVAALSAAACDVNEFDGTRPPGSSELVGKGAFDFAPEGASSIEVLYYVPRAATLQSPVVIALHGNNRDGEGTRDDWISKAEQYGLAVFAPRFDTSDFPGSSGYILGNVFDDGNDVAGQSPKDEGEWALSYIEPLFDEIRRRTGIRTPGYELVGHSGGAQFAHRYLMFNPTGRHRRVVAANAGWYTVPDPAISFPYGLADSPLEGRPADYFGQQLVLLLGDRDTDPSSAGLRHTPEADAQGLNRFARGQFFFDRARALAPAGGAPFAWTLEVVQGVGHDGGRMIVAAADLLFE